MKHNVIAAALIVISAGVIASEKGHDMSSMKNGMTHDMSSMEGNPAPMGHDMGSMAGSPGVAKEVSRTIDVSMDDNMRFTPKAISVKQGETIRFFIKNNGKLPHEFVLGTTSELKEHAEMMQQMQGMQMQHSMPNMVSLAPNQKSAVLWKFEKSGMLSFTCLMPGHMEAGMVGEIVVK